MSRELAALRAEAGKRKQREPVCIFCGVESEVSIAVAIRERGPSDKYLTGRSASACAPCALAGLDRLYSQNGGQHE